jgi:cell division protein FtsQ
VDDLDLPVAAQRDKAILQMLGDARANNPILYRRISEVSRDGGSGLIIRILPVGGKSIAQEPAISDSAATAGASVPATLRVRASMGVSAARLADIFPVESDLLRRRAKVAELDLRYRDQVIARLQ